MNRRQKDFVIVCVVLNVYALAHMLFCDPSFCGADRVQTYFTWLLVGVFAATLFFGFIADWTRIIHKLRTRLQTWQMLLRHVWINIVYGWLL